jgi:hypothetical protein
MPRGTVVYVPVAAPGRLRFHGSEVPVRPEDVAGDARRPGTRVLFDLVWDDGDFRPRNVRRARRSANLWAVSRGLVGRPIVTSSTGPSDVVRPREAGTIFGGSER